MAMKLPKSRFVWSVFHGRCRRRLLVGLILLVVAAGYGVYAGQRFGKRGGDDVALDKPLVRLARSMTPLPRHLGTIQPENNRELYLVTVIADQQDVLFGMTVLVLRAILAMTAGGLGLVLVAGGSAEWEVRSETASRG